MKPEPLYNIHCHSKESSDKIISFRSFHVDDEDINTEDYFTLGIHPWHRNNKSAQFEKLQKLIHHKNCLAIGEAGIDKLRGPNLQIQEDIFIKQARMADEISKPIIIHCVKAFIEIIRVKQELKPKVPWIIHGFNKNIELAKQLIAQGFYLSLGSGWIKKKETFTELLTQLPADKLFFESDEQAIDTVLELYNLANNYNNFSAIIAKNVNLVFNV